QGLLLPAATPPPSTAAMAHKRLPAFRRRVEATSDPPAPALGALAMAAAGTNEPVGRVAELSQHALRLNARPLPESADRPTAFYLGMAGLIYAEHFDEAQSLV